MKKLLGKCVVIVSLLLFSVLSIAGYNANMSGQLTYLNTYTGTDAVYIRLNNQPQEHPVCNSAWFVLDSSVPEARRQRIFSRLLAAYVAKEAVNIGFDAEGGCADGYIRIHRAG